MRTKLLAKEISHVLELPIWPRQAKPRYDKGTEILQVILKTMVEALRRGEDIKIDGFGILKVRTRPPTRSPFVHFHGNLKSTKVWEIMDLPAKKYVFFQPSTVLLKMLNLPVDTDSQGI